MSITSLLETLYAQQPRTCANVWTLVSAKKQQIANRQLLIVRRQGQYGQYIAIESIDTTNNGVVGTLAGGQLLAYARILDKIAFAPTTYANVMDEPLWQSFYDRKDRLVPYVENGQEKTKSETTIPCMRCGIVLPERLVTIDHQRPQTGGELEAVLKTFRACGLTREGPQGAKGQMILNHLRGQLAMTDFKPVPTKPGRPFLGGVSVHDRYTLNDEGAVLYAIALEAGLEAELQKRCMNSPMNLAPLCQPCNSSKGNKLKF